jgi:PKHD-type hydroxylase
LAFQSIWYYTNLPTKVIDCIEEDLEKYFDQQLHESRTGGGYNGGLDKDIRNAKNAWVPTSHWISGFVWNYVQKANKENFLYELDGIDGEQLQYTVYGPGEHYKWHNDLGISGYFKPQAEGNRVDPNLIASDFMQKNCESIRKLSFSLQLSEPDSYEGGQFQLLDETGNSYIVPRQRGTIAIFDSRTMHRVRPVTKGVRKSIVGWCVGPRWK